MFGRISVARRYLIVVSVSVSKPLLALFRYLFRVVPFPALISLLLLCVLCRTAEDKFADWYFGRGDVWDTGFPSSWRILFLSLFVVPTFSILHLVWLSLHCLAWHLWRCRYGSPSRSSQRYRMLPRGVSGSLEERVQSGIKDEEDCDSEDIEDDADSSRLHSSFQRKAPRQLSSFILSPWFIFWFAISCTSLWLGLHYQQPGDLRYATLIEKANAHPKSAGYANQEKIFIAAMFYNNENVLPYWTDSIIKAIHYLGADNVFVSILESGSDDQSPALLQQLDDRLGAMHVQRCILTQDKAIRKPYNMEGNNRVDFLSALRNRALEPLVENGGYDKVIFSNDIFIEPETILELLYTADGEYDMVCGIDYGSFGLYDTWVVRDKRGSLATATWPHFLDIEGNEAMHTESPVPVFTCWNGIVVFKADPLLPIHLRSNRTLSNDPLPFALPDTHPVAKDSSLRGPTPALTPPIRFRAFVQGECFSSESFLFPYDFRRVFNLQRIFLNSRVIVAYEWRFYVYFKWFMRHPVVKWWIEKVYNGAWMHKEVAILYNMHANYIWEWDGGDCQPFPFKKKGYGYPALG